jgi:hypothetical protein
MHDPRLMRRIQPVRDLYRPLQQFSRWQRLAIYAVLQRLPLQELQGDEGLAFVLAATLALDKVESKRKEWNARVFNRGRILQGLVDPAEPKCANKSSGSSRE